MHIYHLISVVCGDFLSKPSMSPGFSRHLHSRRCTHHVNVVQGAKLSDLVFFGYQIRRILIGLHPPKFNITPENRKESQYGILGIIYSFCYSQTTFILFDIQMLGLLISNYPILL